MRGAALPAYDAAKTQRAPLENPQENRLDYPISVLLGTALVAFLAGYLSNARGAEEGSDWQKRSCDWQRRAHDQRSRALSGAECFGGC